MAVLRDPDVLFAYVSALLIILMNVQGTMFNTVQLLGIVPSSLNVPVESEDVSPHVHEFNHASVIALHSFRFINYYIFNGSNL